MERAMKTFIKFLVPVTVAVTALASCQREVDVVTPDEQNTLNITVKANINDLVDGTGTKTYIGSDGTHDNAILWGAGEYMMIGLSDNTNAIFGKSSDESSDWSGYNEAEFKFSISTPSPQDKYTIMGMYPWSAAVAENNTDPENYLVELPPIQNATAQSYDPAGYIMIAKSETIDKNTTEWEASFRRATALNRITLTNIPEDVLKVVVTAPKSCPLAGQRAINLKTGANGDITGVNVIEIDYANALSGDSKVVWFTSWDASIPVGDKLTISAYSTKKVYSRELTVVNKPITFKEGYLNTLSVNMASADVLSSGIPYTWTLASGDLGTEGSPASSVESKGSPLQLTWTAVYTWGGSNATKYFGWNGDKGVQIGSGSSTNKCSSLVLSTSGYTNYVKNVRINFSHASSGGSSASVRVGNVELKNGSNPSVNGNTEPNYYLFEAPTLVKGDVEITFSNTAAKAFYVKSIEINHDNRTAPQLNYETDEYHVVVGGALETPELSYITGFNSADEITYSIGPGDDPNVANVNPKTGVVTIGNEAGSVTVTATFPGNDDYQPATASYTIVVEEAALSVSSVTPEKAECDANSLVTFTVTSNIAWMASFDSAVVESISPNSGDVSSSPIEVTVTLKANAGSERETSITISPVSDVYSSLEKSVTVIQKEYTANLVYELYEGAISEGDYVIVYNGGAMNTTIDKNRLQVTAVSILNNKITNPDASIVWHIAPNGSYWTLYNDSSKKYAGSTNSKNQAALIASIDDSARWTVEGTSTYEFENLSRSTSNSDPANKWLRRNGDNGFACYAFSTGGALSLYKLNDGKTDSGVALSYSGTVTYAPNDATIQLDVTNPHDVSLAFTSSEETVATVTNQGLVTIKSAGKTTITASWEDKTEGETIYRGGSVDYELTISKATPTIAEFNNPKTAIDVNETVTTNTTTISDSNLSIVYTTSDNTIASINASTGEVTGLKDGIVTISATFAGNGNYLEADSKSYTLTVGDGGSISVTYTVSTINSVTKTGTAPSNSSATYSQTYSTAGQMTSGNSVTLTLSGYAGYKITGASVEVKSNTNKGAGSLTLTTGTKTIASISDNAFSSDSWNGEWSTSFVTKELTVTETTIADNETIVLSIGATANSLYFQSLTLTYKSGESGSGNAVNATINGVTEKGWGVLNQ